MTDTETTIEAAGNGAKMKGLVRFQHVDKNFGEVKVLKDIELTIDQGEVVVIVGPSGSGKSTLLRCINGLETISAGRLIIENQFDMSDPKTDLRKVRVEAGMVFQQFNLFPHMTARENVAFGARRARGKAKDEALATADELLARVGLADRGGHYPDELSGGQQQRVAIARALAVGPKLMLFDEPTSALDPELRGEVLGVMRALALEGMTMIVVTHEMAFANSVGTRLIFMDDGRIAHDGDPAEMFANPPSDRFRDFMKDVA
ncbi:glutamine transport system ATP-binding protein [Rhodobium orientis]|uniref:glutamine ABC transporter ATP-binding protein GlnQ n=1 Tax=Rhodobium orientis TaxID=34017 RepID=UPI0017F97C74|nr:glutamine ABC transporter ATP-binding protein GlnQ [Rhodobium orientis]MBB4301297.1 glutamine transport system ATP-binding protein [Rhodobium orientis]